MTERRFFSLISTWIIVSGALIFGWFLGMEWTERFSENGLGPDALVRRVQGLTLLLASGGGLFGRCGSPASASPDY